eukprot:TRINITY_DN23459_c0_g1_i1.p2 TRINITY_DN23459_c0_g1~~TRINITY_DN23459_c0_g1_i1.p2  ORF type:complete len:126 (+),score=8.87 TRINITY_DN23459_c0_g1_i1:208-585(+)
MLSRRKNHDATKNASVSTTPGTPDTTSRPTVDVSTSGTTLQGLRNNVRHQVHHLNMATKDWLSQPFRMQVANGAKMCHPIRRSKMASADRASLYASCAGMYVAHNNQKRRQRPVLKDQSHGRIYY